MPKIMDSSTLRAALDYAEMGWPVLPGAIWHDGHFADQADGSPVTDPCLRPPGDATSDTGRVREWWSGPGLRRPNVLTVTGSRLGAFMVAENLVMKLADDPRFAASPTPVLAFPNMPIAYFLIQPPLPSVLLSRDARVVDAGLPLPLPPSVLDTTPVMWLIAPEQAGNRLVSGDALADLIHEHERKTA
ncbi:bifunctional DNA primase/polymerase [Saccharothrix sp. S26]|uniref:bifunctional DNA primase/polymerase n=1 Tax=Saccharothrix sp. S26 TaxID=2907215 RepID=UPI001F1D74C7|nr:bifunctional DNA primase/polymerase [Saccharothrix sp. S26]MCE6997764.1 bifunctional DNA primase/polymerase [Saccharothrix sp. S26]